MKLETFSPETAALAYQLWQYAPHDPVNPTHEEIAPLAYALWQNYGAAGFELDSVTIWLQAEQVLRWRAGAASGEDSSCGELEGT